MQRQNSINSNNLTKGLDFAENQLLAFIPVFFSVEKKRKTLSLIKTKTLNSFHVARVWQHFNLAENS